MQNTKVINDQALTGTERRKSPRMPVNISLLYSLTTIFNSKAVMPLRLVKTSLSGAQGQSAEPLKIGQWLNLKLGNGVYEEGASYLPPIFLKNAEIKAKVVRAIDVDMDANGEGQFTYDLVYAKGWKHTLQYWIYKFVPAIVCLLFMAGTINVLYLKSFNLYFFWYKPILNIYSLTISFYILSRFFLAIFYKPPEYVGYLPDISVIIACKNEEDSIRKTIDYVYRSDYPKASMKVIVINDGSTDGTLQEMQLAARIYPNLTIINFEKNLGKRHGMAAGARRAKGEVLVYIDSDSFVEKGALKKIVQGFADPSVGAVCGHANVSNAKKNMLTKMQQVRYFVAFRVLKASESLFWTVSCCSGCLAAYRRSYVMEILDTWLYQKFLGVQATFGDDRSLTNFMLRRYRVIYDSEAVCSTLVPSKYYVFFTQQLRWKKSWVRETLIACKFIWKRHPLAAFFFYMGAIFPIVAPFIVINALVLPLFVLNPISFLYIYGAFLMACLYSIVYLGYFRDGIWVYGVAFCFFYMLVLVWQTYYAILTVRQNHWGTR